MPRTTTATRLAGDTVYQLKVSVATRNMRKLQNRLDYLAKTVKTRNGGAHNDTDSWLWIDTYWTKDELDRWLDVTKHGCDVGEVYHRDPSLVID